MTAHHEIARDDTVAVTSSGRERVLVGADWLAAHLNDARVKVVEVDVSPARYDAGHIENSLLWNIYRDLKDPDYHLHETAVLESLLSRSGITRDTTVVFYGYAPAMGVWLLRLLGHSDARILDCSRETWQAEGHPWSLSTTTPQIGTPAVGRPEPGPHANVRVDVRADEALVRHAIGSPGVRLLDVRSTPEYVGERFWPSGALQPDGRPGHIPTAVHVPIDNLYDARGAFLPVPALRKVFAASGLDGDDELLTYCAIGGRAATAWFVLTELLGRERVRVYDGSWAEWGRRADTPVETS